MVMDGTTARIYRDRDGERAAGALGRLLLLLGTAWVLFSLAIPQLDVDSHRSIAILLGIVLVASAASEIPVMRAAAAGAPEWRRSTHALLAALCVVGAVVAWAWPDPTTRVLARLIAWYLLIKGTHDIINAFAVHRAERGAGETAPWWSLLSVGAFEIGIAFWAVGYTGHSHPFLNLWIGLAALATGLTKILMAFRTTEALQPVGAEGRIPPTGFGAPAVTETARTKKRAHRPIG